MFMKKNFLLHEKNIILLIGCIIMCAVLAGCAGYGGTTGETTAEKVYTSDKIVKDKGKVTFSTTDIDGNKVDDSILKNADITLINYFEDWCSWCLYEIPDLEELNEKYSDKGFQVIGVCDTNDVYYGSDLESIFEIREQYKLTYPLIVYNEELEAFDLKEGRPHSIFVDSEGNILRVVDEEFYEKLCYEQTKAETDKSYELYKEYLDDSEIKESMSEEEIEQIENFISSYENDREACIEGFIQYCEALNDSDVGNGDFGGWRSGQAWEMLIRYFLGL